jgi:hypothetical protein
LTLLFTRLTFFSLGQFGLSQFLFNHCHCLHPTFSQDLHKIRSCSSVGSIMKSQHARHTTPYKNQHAHPTVWNIVHWLPRYACTVIYRAFNHPGNLPAAYNAKVSTINTSFQ